MSPRPLVKEGDSNDDVLDAKLRLNLCGADPQLPPTEDFDAATTAATKAFQGAQSLLADGRIGNDTWTLLDAADGGRLATAAVVQQALTTRAQARALLDQADFAGAKSMLDPLYAAPGLPPEVRQPIVADLAWAQHGLGDVDAARDLYLQFASSPMVTVLSRRDVLQRLKELTLGQPPGPIESSVTASNLP